LDLKDEEEESELVYHQSGHAQQHPQQQQQQQQHPQQQQQRSLNLQHYVGHSLVKHQAPTTPPPPTPTPTPTSGFRPLSRIQHQQHYQPKHHKPGQFFGTTF
jgi:hypothetical protein